MRHRIHAWLDRLIGFHKHCICQDERMSAWQDGRYTVVILNDQVMIPQDEDSYQRGYDDALLDHKIKPEGRP